MSFLFQGECERGYRDRGNEQGMGGDFSSRLILAGCEVTCHRLRRGSGNRPMLAWIRERRIRINGVIVKFGFDGMEDVLALLVRFRGLTFRPRRDLNLCLGKLESMSPQLSLPMRMCFSFLFARPWRFDSCADFNYGVKVFIFSNHSTSPSSLRQFDHLRWTIYSVRPLRRNSC